MDIVTLQILAVVFISTFIRSTFGFGEALIAVPLLAFSLPIRIAVPLAVLLSITIAAMIVIQDRKKIHWQATGWLLLPTCLGTPLGVVLLTMAPHILIKIILGIFIIFFSGYCLIAANPPELRQDSRPWMLTCGFAAGLLGGAYGMNGPPLVLYGAMRRWTPQHFRATLQGYFLPASILAMAGYWFAGLWVPSVTHYYLVSLPVALPTIFLGRMANHRLSGDVFLRFIHGGLIGIGALLLMQALSAPPQ